MIDIRLRLECTNSTISRYLLVSCSRHNFFWFIRNWFIELFVRCGCGTASKLHWVSGNRGRFDSCKSVFFNCFCVYREENILTVSFLYADICRRKKPIQTFSWIWSGWVATRFEPNSIIRITCVFIRSAPSAHFNYKNSNLCSTNDPLASTRKSMVCLASHQWPISSFKLICTETVFIRVKEISLGRRMVALLTARKLNSSHISMSLIIIFSMFN